MNFVIEKQREFMEKHSELLEKIESIDNELQQAKEKHKRDIEEVTKSTIEQEIETCPLRLKTGRCRGPYVCAHYSILGPCEVRRRWELDSFAENVDDYVQLGE